jgi:hypothetical protein
MEGPKHYNVWHMLMEDQTGLFRAMQARIRSLLFHVVYALNGREPEWSGSGCAPQELGEDFGASER